MPAVGRPDDRPPRKKKPKKRARPVSPGRARPDEPVAAKKPVPLAKIAPGLAAATKPPTRATQKRMAAEDVRRTTPRLEPAKKKARPLTKKELDAVYEAAIFREAPALGHAIAHAPNNRRVTSALEQATLGLVDLSYNSRSARLGRAESVRSIFGGGDMIVPWPGPLGAAARATASAERAAEAGAIAPETTGPWGKFVQPAPPTRVFRGPQGQAVEVPAAGSHIGRGVERTLDATRDRLSPVTGGFVRTHEQKFYKARGEVEQMTSRLKGVQARVIRKATKGLNKGQRYALQAYADNTAPNVAIDAHKRWMTGDARGDLFHAEHIKGYEAAKQYLTPDVQFVPGPEGARLAKAFAELERGITTREEIGLALGKLTDETLTSGRNAPGRVYRGAEYVKPTPGRLGKSPALDKATAYRDRLAAAVARAEARVARMELDRYGQKAAGGEIIDEATLATRQAQALEIRDVLRPLEKDLRLLQREWDAPASTLIEKRASLNRILRSATDAEHAIEEYAAKAGIDPETLASVAQIRDEVALLNESIKAARGASSDALRDVRKRVTTLRATLRKLEKPVAYKTEGLNPKVVTAKGQVILPKGSSRLARLRAAHSEADMRVKQLEEAAARRETPTGLVGAEDFTTARLYTHTTRGVPGLRAQVWASLAERTPRRSGTKITNNPRTDPAMSHPHTGHLLHSGAFRVDPGNSTAAALETAIRMDHFSRALQVVQETATPRMRSLFDQAVVLDPERFAQAYPESYSAGRQAAAMRKLYDDLEALAAENKGTLRAEWLDKAPKELVDALRDAHFPSDVKGELGHEIPGIGWVNPSAVNEMGIFHLAEDQKAWANAFLRLSHHTKFDSSFFRRLNTLSRFLVLYLNPAYIPVNLAGNLMLNLFQQGIFLPRNIVKASYLSLKLDPQYVYKMDALLGEGLTASAGPASKFADAITYFVDRLPRRMAFVHEAERQGYKTAADFERLLSGESKDLLLIRRRAVNAIVDYERLSPFEKTVARNFLAFYPWTKGAIHYSLRFPLEHPYQALAVAAAFYGQDKLADEKLGDDRAPWDQFRLPVATAADGRPISVNLGSLTPFTTTAQMGEFGYGLATGNPHWGNALSVLAPGVGQLVESGTGVTGIGSEADYGLPGAAKGIAEMAAPVRLVERGSIQKALLGSLNPEVYSHSRRKRQELIDDSKALGLGEPPAEVLDDFEWRAQLDHAAAAEKTYEGKFRVAAALYEKRTGDHRYVERSAHGVSEERAHSLYDRLRDRMTHDVKRWDRKIDHKHERNMR